MATVQHHNTPTPWIPQPSFEVPSLPQALKFNNFRVPSAPQWAPQSNFQVASPPQAVMLNNFQVPTPWTPQPSFEFQSPPQAVMSNNFQVPASTPWTPQPSFELQSPPQAVTLSNFPSQPSFRVPPPIQAVTQSNFQVPPAPQPSFKVPSPPQAVKEFNPFMVPWAPRQKIVVSGFGRTWDFDLKASVGLILRAVRKDIGSGPRLVLEATRAGCSPVKYNLGEKVTAVAEGWRLTVRCVPKIYKGADRVRLLLNPWCSLCGEGPRTKALLECRHLMCEECAIQMATIHLRCPICNNMIRSCTEDITEPYEPLEIEQPPAKRTRPS